MRLQTAVTPWRKIPLASKFAPWKRLRNSFPRRTYSQAGATALGQEENTEKIEEETLELYSPANFYPAYIGEVLASKYKIVGKVGYGASSTIWLARDLKLVPVTILYRSL